MLILIPHRERRGYYLKAVSTRRNTVDRFERLYHLVSVIMVLYSVRVELGHPDM